MATAGRIVSEVVSSSIEAELVSSSLEAKLVSTSVETELVYEFPSFMAGTVLAASTGHRPRLRGIIGVSDPLQAWKLVGSSQDSATYQVQAESLVQADALYVAGSSAGVDVLEVTDSTGATGLFTFHVSTDEVDSGLYHPATSPVIGSTQRGDVEAGSTLQLTPPADTTWTSLWGVQGWGDNVLRGTITQPWNSSTPNVYTAPAVSCVELAVKTTGESVYRVFLYVHQAGALLAYCVPFCGEGETLQVQVQGGTAPYTYSVVSGTASVSSSGLISGTIEDADWVELVTVRVTDSASATSDLTIYATTSPWGTAPVAATSVPASSTSYLGDPLAAYWQTLALVSSTGGSTLSEDGLYVASAIPGTRDHIRWTDSDGGVAELYLRVIQGERMQWIEGTDKEALLACGALVSLVGRGGAGAPHTWALLSSGSGGTLGTHPVNASETAWGHTSVAYLRVRDSAGSAVDLSAATVTALVRSPTGDVLVSSAVVHRPDAYTIAVVLPHPGALDLWESHLNLEVTVQLGLGVTVNAELLFESPSLSTYEAVR